jgi:5-methylcytosine-specific restriction protein B
MLIEKDWRGEMIRLLYNNEQFSVPKNVYIIGLMNTADRSLALLDYALRRRFSFYELKPAFDSDNFKAKLSKINNNKLDKLIDVIKTLNEEICKDDSLGEGFEIGHSYFSNLDEIGDVAKLESKLNEVVNFDIIPMLKEYWFDDKAKLNLWSDNLKATLK